jgi:hypothetical protein
MLYFRQKCKVFSSVVDPDSLNPDWDTDPVPAYQVNPDTAEKNYLISIKNCNLLIFTVQFRYCYPYSAPHLYISLSRELPMSYFRQKCTDTVFSSVADLDSLNPDRDPDPAFKVNPDTVPDPDPLKNNSQKIVLISFFDQKLQFTNEIYYLPVQIRILNTGFLCHGYRFSLQNSYNLV